MIRIGSAVIFDANDTTPWITPAHINRTVTYNPRGLGELWNVYSGRSSHDVDWTAGYSHDATQVAEHTTAIRNQIGIAAFDSLYLRIHVLPYDTYPSFNGSTWEDFAYYDDKLDPPQPNFKNPLYGSIILYGKPTPVTPGSTEYVTYHEIGHAFQHRYACSSYRDRIDYAYWAEYVERRAIIKVKTRPTRWHESAAEVFADDFRATFGRVERWNHGPEVEPTPEWVADWIRALPGRPSGEAKKQPAAT